MSHKWLQTQVKRHASEWGICLFLNTITEVSNILSQTLSRQLEGIASPCCLLTASHALQLLWWKMLWNPSIVAWPPAVVGCDDSYPGHLDLLMQLVICTVLAALFTSNKRTTNTAHYNKCPICRSKCPDNTFSHPVNSWCLFYSLICELATSLGHELDVGRGPCF